VVLGALTALALLVLAHFGLGIPLAGLPPEGAVAAAPPPPPASLIEVVLLVAAGVGGFVTAWLAPGRPLLHAVVLAGIFAGGALVAAAGGMVGADSFFLVLLIPVAAVIGGWLRSRPAPRRGHGGPEGPRGGGGGGAGEDAR